MSKSNQRTSEPLYSRRSALKLGTTGALAAGAILSPGSQADEPPIAAQPRPWIQVRGIYGGYPQEILQKGHTPADYGINAIWVGSGSLKAEEIARFRKLGMKIFAEFNSMHAAEYLKDHPDAAPIGPDGNRSPAPQGWQGVSPFHVGYRRQRMTEFRRVLKTFDIDGIWLDYHHSHASWERAKPDLPDTDFSPSALRQFSESTGIELPTDVPAAAKVLLGERRDAWTQFRCAVFTDWVREYREILDEVRPRALLGTFHCPWSLEDYEGAIRHKLAIDLKSQSKYVDVFSIMPYHARFGHVKEPEWIARQIKRLGELLELDGTEQEKKRIWPIVQLSDWGERVPVEQVETVLDFAARSPATGLIAFHWNGISKEWDKIEALKRAYLSYRST